jgi:hypothetical protein
MAVSGSSEIRTYEFPIVHFWKNIIFLDIDGVLNHQLFYEERYKHITRFDNIPFYKTVKKYLRKLVKGNEMSRKDYYKSQICPIRMAWINNLCDETNSAVVLSSTWRNIGTVYELNKIFHYCGATFTIIDKTGSCRCRVRGVEINEWMHQHTEKWFDVKYYDFYRYAIIDDDSDMLLNQADHFFKTDFYCGLTPSTCYRIKRYFTHKTFHHND